MRARLTAQVVFQELHTVMRVIELFDVRVLNEADGKTVTTRTDGTGASIRLPLHQPRQAGVGMLLPVRDVRLELTLRP